jgi:hypothetical protein
VIVTLCDPDGSGLYNKVLIISSERELNKNLRRRSGMVSCMTARRVKGQREDIKLIPSSRACASSDNAWRVDADRVLEVSTG